jgi:uncharacterized UPF0160 family protein
MTMTDRKLTVATHRGRFHADEAFGVAVLSLAGFKLKVVRLGRGDPAVHQADFKLDIGRRHDPARGYFDHHQGGGAGKRAYPAPHNVPYATAGLVWRHFGPQLCDHDPDLFEAVDKALFLHVDAVDYGLKLYGGDTVPVSTIVAQHNSDDEANDTEQHRRFMQAVAMCKQIVANAIRDARKQRRCATIIRDAIARNRVNSTSLRVLELPEQVEWRGKESKQLLVNSGVDVLIMPGGQGEQALVHVVNRDLAFSPVWCQGSGVVAGAEGKVVFTNHRHARADSPAAARALADIFLRVNNRLDDGWRDTPSAKSA